MDVQVGSLVIQEFTAASGPEPRTVQRRVAFGPNTSLELVRRAGEGTGGWIQGYAALPLSRAELNAGDFVTVSCQRDDGG